MDGAKLKKKSPINTLAQYVKYCGRITLDTKFGAVLSFVISALFEIESHCRAKSVLEHTMQTRLQIHSNRLVPAFKVLGFQVEVTRPGS